MNIGEKESKLSPSKRAKLLFSALVAVMLVGESGAVLAAAPVDGRIGYALTYRVFAVYETEEATECPQGFNDGPRELYTKQFPDDGTERTVLETQLLREGRIWHPTDPQDDAPLLEAQGDIAYGLNLDGKIEANDFQSPEGEEGIDNELYRVLGCITQHRKASPLNHFVNLYLGRYNSNRWMIELSGVDDLSNDNEVTVTTYRGRNYLLADATGEGFLAGGTQNIDMRWGKDFINQVKGRIVDGVLTTDPLDEALIPWSSTFSTSGYQTFRGLQLKLDLTPESAEGLMAGYADVDKFNHHLNTIWSTHHQSYGQESSSLQYPALVRLADGFPDPETGVNTAISMAVQVKFTQVYIIHPEQEGEQAVLTAR